MVLWFYGCMLLWFVWVFWFLWFLWFYDFMVLWLYSFVILWFYGFIILYFIVLWFCGFKFSWFQEVATFPSHAFLTNIGLIAKIFEILLNGSSGFVGARLFEHCQNFGLPTF